MTKLDASHPARTGRLSRRELLRQAGFTAAAVIAVNCAPGTGPSTGGNSARPAPPQTLTIGATAEPRGLDPLLDDSGSTFAYNLLYDSLVALDNDLKPIPSLATWDVSSDGKTYTFNLRSGVTFHDGSPLTADDVKFSFERILDQKNASSKRGYLNVIQRIEAVDPSTVRMTLADPFGPFIFAVSVLGQIVPRKVVEQLGNDGFTRKPVGTGPFKFVEWRPQEQIVYSRNDSYWLEKPKLEKVIMKTIPDVAVAASNLLSGDVDVIEKVTNATLAQLKGDSKARIVSRPGAEYSYVFFGLGGRVKPFSDRRFRQAVYHSFDADGLVQAFFPTPELGRRAYATTPPEFWPGGDYEGMKALSLKKDPARARQLFDELIKEGVMPADYHIQMIVDTFELRQRSAEAVVSGLKAIGMNATLTVLEFGSYANRFLAVPKGNENLMFVMRIIPYAPDPDASVFDLLGGGTHGQGLGLPADHPLQVKIRTARGTVDAEVRKRLYNEVMREAVTEVYGIPLFFENVVVAADQNVVGLSPAPRRNWNLVTSFTNVHIE